jgi:hypothetical protein
MKTVVIASAALLISASAFAQTGGGRANAPGQSVVPTTPGQQYRTNGPTNDMPWRIWLCAWAAISRQWACDGNAWCIRLCAGRVKSASLKV